MRPRPEGRRPHRVADRIKEQSTRRRPLEHVAAGGRAFPGPTKGLHGDHFPRGSGPVVLIAVPAPPPACFPWQKCSRAGIGCLLRAAVHEAWNQPRISRPASMAREGTLRSQAPSWVRRTRRDALLSSKSQCTRLSLGFSYQVRRSQCEYQQTWTLNFAILWLW